MSAKPELGTEDWWRGHVLRQRRDADKLRVLLVMARHVFGLFGLKLRAVEVDAEGGRARAIVLGMLESQDMAAWGLMRSPVSEDVIVIVEGIEIRHRQESRR